MGTSHNSNYFPGGIGLTAANGDAVTVGSGLTLTNNVLTGTGVSSGSSSSSGPRAKSYLITVYNGGMQGGSGGSIITTPYFFTIFAELPGTINAVRFGMISADGANFNATVQVIPYANGASASTVAVNFNGVSNPLPVSNGENGGGSTVAGYAGSGNAVLTYNASSQNTYQVGDALQVTFGAVGGTFQAMSVQLSVTE